MRTQRALNNVFIQLVARFIGLILYFSLTPYIISKLGNDVYGLNQLLLQTVGYFNLAELGVGVSLSVLMYKHLVSEDKEKINSLLSAAQLIYTSLGIALLVLGVIFSCYISSIFSLKESGGIAQIAFIIYILSAAITFFFSVPSILLNTSQKGYKAFVYTLVIPIFTYVGFVTFTYLEFSVIGIALTTLLLTSINLYGINRIAKKEFPWMRLWEEKRDWSLLKTTKNVFIDKILVLAVFQTDYILISYFLGVTYVAGYAIYTMLFSFLKDFVFMALGNITNGTGEMYEKGELGKVYQLWRDALSFCFFIGIILCIGLYFMFGHFIKLWMNDSIVLSKPILICFILNLFYLLTVHSSTVIIGSRNLYQKRIKGSVVELLANVIFSVILIQKYGVFGAILGTTIGHYCMNSWFIPILFLKSVNKKPLIYLTIWLRYLIAATLIFTSAYFFYQYVLIELITAFDSYLRLFAGVCLFGIFLVLISISVFFFLDSNFDNFKIRLLGIGLLVKNRVWKE